MADNWRSRTITQGAARSPNRAMLRAVGFGDGDFQKAIVGVANGHSTMNPCNAGIQPLVDRAAAAVKAAGAMARINVPGIVVYAGTIKPGFWKGQKLTIVSPFEAVGALAAGKISQEDFDGIEKNACPSVGACGGQYTANTMSSSFEALGMSLLGSSQMASPDPEKAVSAAESAKVLVNAIRKKIRPRDIITRKAIENAVAMVMATGGSTNAVLHYLAIAAAAGVKWSIDDFERMRRRVPVLCNLKPSGPYVATDFHAAGGVPQVLKMLLAHGLARGECMTITGRTLAEELANVPEEPRTGQDVIRPWNRPVYAQGHLAIDRK